MGIIDGRKSAVFESHTPGAGPAKATCDHVASYIAQLSDELGRLASAKNLTFLASLLNLAALEAKRMSDTTKSLMQ